MPCTYTGSLDGDKLLSCQQELDRVTRYLCGTLDELSNHDYIPMEMLLYDIESTTDGIERGELVKWWESHRKTDNQRKKTA